MPKTVEEKLISAQGHIRKLKAELTAAEHYAHVNRIRVSELQARLEAESMASFMWIAYLVRKYGKNRVLKIPKAELYQCAGDMVIATLDEKQDMIIVRVKARGEDDTE